MPYIAKLAKHPVVYLVGIGDVVLVVLAHAGQTNSATTLDLFLPTSGVWRQAILAMGPWWTDATARAGYATTTTTTTTLATTFTLCRPTVKLYPKLSNQPLVDGLPVSFVCLVLSCQWHSGGSRGTQSKWRPRSISNPHLSSQNSKEPLRRWTDVSSNGDGAQWQRN